MTGTALGNITNQMRRALDEEPVVKYKYSAMTIPMMLIGAVIGVYFNKLAPNLVTVSGATFEYSRSAQPAPF